MPLPKPLKYFYIFVSLLLILLFSFLFSFTSHRSDSGSLLVHFYDVGQGDAIFIQTPSGHQILIDGGEGNIILDHLGRDLPFYDKDLDLVILTHPHLDHLGGLLEVARRYRIDLVISNPFSYQSGAYKEWLSLIAGDTQLVRSVYAGDNFCFEEVCFSVLWPLAFANASAQQGPSTIENGNGVEKYINPCSVLDEGVCSVWTDENLNNGSLVLLMTYQDKKILLTGDAEREVWQALLADEKLKDIDVLKVPHHGSTNGITLEALGILRPEQSIVSVGKDNRYGLPDEQVLGWVGDYGQIYSTMVTGTVEMAF